MSGLIAALKFNAMKADAPDEMMPGKEEATHAACNAMAECGGQGSFCSES